MISNNIKNDQTELPNTPITPTGDFYGISAQRVTASLHTIDTISNPQIQNIRNYQVDNFENMNDRGIPSIKNFLILCKAENQQLAASKLDNMLKSAKGIDVLNWEINYFNERFSDLSNINSIDNLNNPLEVAAKYGNTDICNVLINHLQKNSEASFTSLLKQISLNPFFAILDIINLRSTMEKYNAVMKQEESKNIYKAFKKALIYNNIETAECLYNAYRPAVQKVYAKIFMYMKLMDVVVKEEKYFKQFLAVLASWAAKNNNWDFFDYVFSKQIHHIQRKPNEIKKELLYQLLKYKKIDLANIFLDNISIDNFDITQFVEERNLNPKTVEGY